MKKSILILLFMFFLLSGCSQKPSTVSQEIWDDGIQYTIYLNKTLKDKEVTPDGFNDGILSYLSIGKDELSEEETEIINNISKLNISFLEIQIFRLTGGEESASKKKFDEYYKKLEKTFGKSNLSEGKLDMSFINTASKENATKQVIAQEDENNKFKVKAGTSTTAKEVQYNMINNLDKKFFIEGSIELCDYFNYGFTNESKFFCGQVTPLEGGYSDSWYLYFNRETFDSLYDKLMGGQVSYIRVSAQIPSKVYKESQGNMAVVHGAEWK